MAVIDQRTAADAGYQYGRPGFESKDSWMRQQEKKRQEQVQAASQKQMEQRQAQVPHFNAQYGQYSQLANQFGNRQVENSPFRQGQQQIGQQYAREAAGNGVGQRLIQQQAQGMADRGMQQQLSMAASARPGQGASAARNAMFNSAGLQAQVGGQSAMAAGQHQLGAMGQYGQFLQGARGQDDDLRLRQLGLNDQSQLNALGQRLQLGGMQQQGNQFTQNINLQRELAANANDDPSWQERALGAARDAAATVAAVKTGGASLKYAQPNGKWAT